MTAPELSETERATLARIEAAQPAPESWAIVRQVRAALEDAATDLEWAATKQDRPDVALGFSTAAGRIRERLDAEQ